MANIEIPDKLYEKLEKAVKESKFDSIGEYLEYVLNELLSDEDNSKEEYSKEDEEKVKERLKALGYM